MERWKIIEPGYYEVSDYGRVRSAVDRPGTYRGRIIRGNLDSEGTVYHQVKLVEDGKKKALLVHRLVAEAFIGPCPEGKEVNHKDGLKLHNVPKNLEYMTSRENHEHAARLGLKAKGEKNGSSKLTVQEVEAIRKRYSSGFSTYRQIAKSFGVSHVTIKNIVLKRNWK